MKKALLTIAIVVAALSTQAQNFRIGVSGGINSTWLMNKNVFDANDGLDIAATFGGRFGIDAIYSFNDKIGVGLGFNFISTNSQKYTGDNIRLDGGVVNGLNGDITTKLNYFDIPIMLRLTSSGGTYFEIGPQFGFLTKAEATYENNDNSVFDFEDFDIKDDFESTNIALVFGFGVDIDVTEKVFITTGLRLGYGFTDVTKEYDTPAEYYAANPEALIFTESHVTSLNAHYDDNGKFNYEKTSRVFGGLHIGISYKFGGN
ncbi:MAG: PorT family protein [Bacteroidota bacterium]|nr:PorT family protein [Bacteroidota bacterium]